MNGNSDDFEKAMAEAAEFFGAVIVRGQDPADTVKSYSDLSQRYDDLMKKTKYRGPELLVKYFINMSLPKDSLILDICCGTGAVGEYLVQSGYENIHGLDGSPGMLEISRNKGIYQECHEVFINGPLPFDNGTYDVLLLVGCMALGHLPPETINYFPKVVKTGGYILMQVWIGASTDELSPAEKEDKTLKDMLDYNTKLDQHITTLIAKGILRRKGERLITQELIYGPSPFTLDVFEVLQNV